jgi:hypothetical protein
MRMNQQTVGKIRAYVIAAVAVAIAIAYFMSR